MKIIKERKEPKMNISVALTVDKLEQINKDFKKSVYKNRSAYILHKLGSTEE